METVVFLAEQLNIPNDKISYYYIHSDLKTLSISSIVKPINDIAYIIVIGSSKWKNGPYINDQLYFLGFFDGAYSPIDKVMLGNWAITNIEFKLNYYFQGINPAFEIRNINDNRVIVKRFNYMSQDVLEQLNTVLGEYSIFDRCPFKDVFISPDNESSTEIEKELNLLGLHTRIQTPLIEELYGRRSYDKFIINYNYELSESQLKILFNLLKKRGGIAVRPRILLSKDSKFCLSTSNPEFLLKDVIITKKEPITNIYDGECYKGIPLKKLFTHKDLETYLEKEPESQFFIEPVDIEIFLSYLEDNMSKEDILKTFNVISYAYPDISDVSDHYGYDDSSSCSWEEIGRDEMESWENGWEWNID
ncbi:MAG: hypothetical protein K2I90_11105 [Odoribacter sp.]|nr:hypothetical protein [Odoribacter sp.]